MQRNSDRHTGHIRSRLVHARLTRHWSQKDLAQLLGVKPLSISRWERGLSNPSARMRQKLCDLFDMNEAALELGETSREAGFVFFCSPRALEYFTAQDAARRSDMLLDLGWLAWRRGDYPEAKTHLQDGLMLAREIGDRERIVGLLHTLGSVAYTQRDYDQAMEHYQEGLMWARGKGDQTQACLILLNLGKGAIAQGLYTQADLFLDEGVVLVRQISKQKEYQPLLGALLVHRCFVACMMGDKTREGKYLQGILNPLHALPLLERGPFITTLLQELDNIQLNAQNPQAAENYIRDVRNALSQIREHE